MEPMVLAVDLGGTQLRAALVDARGRIADQRAEPTLAQAGPDAVVAQIVTLAAPLVSAGRPTAVGIGAPGPLDPVAGIAIGPPTLRGWRDVPLAAMIGARLGLATRVENDANAAALGEWRFGAGRGLASLVFVTVSTGIGGGVIADGRLLHGRRGLAAEIGHMTITAEGPRCACGATGCFEAVASGPALARRAAEFAASTARGETLLSDHEEPTGRHVVEAAQAGDALALRLLAEEARWLGIGFTNLLHLYSPDAIVVGGGVAHGLDLMRAGIEATIRERAMPPYRDVPLVAATLGQTAGLVGAAALVLPPNEPAYIPAASSFA